MSRWLIFMWAVIGAVVGQVVGAALASHFSALELLDRGLSLGFDPTNINLGFVILTLGIQVKLSIGGAIGLVLALWLALRNG
ncbi:MAG TPA: DUF4321 domain-containing protein [Symbiobacteriaceae bacterium]|nr:DUF4321 domain-containing protein [Symbiobacteriaceae bacterium]